MLVGNVEAAVSPSLTDLNTSHLQQLAVYISWSSATAERVGNDVPTTSGVPGHKTIGERPGHELTRAAARFMAASRVSSFSDYGGQIFGLHPLFPSSLLGKHSTGSHVTVRRHVGTLSCSAASANVTGEDLF